MKQESRQSSDRTVQVAEEVYSVTLFQFLWKFAVFCIRIEPIHGRVHLVKRAYHGVGLFSVEFRFIDQPVYCEWVIRPVVAQGPELFTIVVGKVFYERCITVVKYGFVNWL